MDTLLLNQFLLLGAILFSYLNPVVNLIHTYTGSSAERVQLHKLQAGDLDNFGQKSNVPEIVLGKSFGESCLQKMTLKLVMKEIPLCNNFFKEAGWR